MFFTAEFKMSGRGLEVLKCVNVFEHTNLEGLRSRIGVVRGNGASRNHRPVAVEVLREAACEC